MAQRMESVAPSGGVMLSASTARLVNGAAALGESEMVHIKGAKEPVTAYRLLGMGEQHCVVRCAESALVGRRWEMSAVKGLLERAVVGQGAVVGVVGPPGIGKSRLAREVSAMASVRDVEVCWPDGSPHLFPRPHANPVGAAPLGDSTYRRRLGRWLRS